MMQLFFHSRLLVVCAALLPTWRAKGLRVDRNLSSQSWTRIKAYFVNLDDSPVRRTCMETQLQGLRMALVERGVDLTFARAPAMELRHCGDVRACALEAPQCFPSRKVGEVSHPGSEDEAAALRGVIANWCSHLTLLSDIAKAEDDFDFFFILEDDAIFDLQLFTESLTRLLQASERHWALVAFDTFDGGNGKPLELQAPAEDMVTGALSGHGDLPLYTISHAWGYWGAHAWLLDAQHVGALATFGRSIPTVPLDWLPKMAHPLHLGMMSYNAGAVRQRKHVSKKDLGNKSPACFNINGSDILSAISKPTSNAVTPREQEVMRDVLLLGMQDSGVDVFHQLLRDNLEEPNGLSLCRGYEAGGCGGVGAHADPGEVQAQRGKSLRKSVETLSVVMVRHPFSLLWSWKNKRHNITLSGQGLTAEGNLQSLASVWNARLTGYLSLRSTLKSVAFVRYEDLVERPRKVLRLVAPRLGLVAPGKLQGRRLHDREDAAAAKLRRHDYRAQWSPKELDTLCSELDKGLLAAFGYSGCENRKKDRKYSSVTTILH